METTKRTYGMDYFDIVCWRHMSAEKLSQAYPGVEWLVIDLDAKKWRIGLELTGRVDRHAFESRERTEIELSALGWEPIPELAGIGAVPDCRMTWTGIRKTG